jgi:hypothetical protein
MHAVPELTILTVCVLTGDRKYPSLPTLRIVMLAQLDEYVSKYKRASLLKCLRLIL